MKKIILLAVLLIAFSFLDKVSAQVAVLTGANYTTIRHQIEVPAVKGVFGFQVGSSINFYPIKAVPRLSVQSEILFSQKGFKQKMDTTYYTLLYYLSLNNMLKYPITKDISVLAGVEIGQLLFGSKRKTTDTYNKFDAGLSLGLDFFESKKVNLYARYTYGLVPLLDYYTFDEWGNFTSEFSDYYNQCLTIGIKYKFSHEKITLYK